MGAAAFPERVGPYKLEELIGEGGYGRVYRGRHETLGYPVAVKILDRVREEDFWQEVRALARLEHPYIVRVWDVYPEDRAIVMEYIPHTLRTWVDTRHPDRKEWLQLLYQVAQALDFLHQQEYIHGDVKPSNILVQEVKGQDPEARLADLGLASQDPDPRRGTPEYLAPEQVRRWSDPEQSLDGRVDQYALALVAYELLTGRYPFEKARNDPNALAYIRLNRLPPPPGDLDPGLRAFDEPLLRALDPDPDKRFPSCTAFIQALMEAEGKTLEDQAKQIRKDLEQALRQQRLEETREHFRRLQRVLQPLTERDRALGRYLEMLEQWHRARELARRARELRPDLQDPDGLFWELLPPSTWREWLRMWPGWWVQAVVALALGLPLGLAMFYLALLLVAHKGP